MSDTHGLHWQLVALSDADVLVPSGDFTMSGAERTEDTVFVNASLVNNRYELVNKPKLLMLK